jgi:hypothetical protein
MSPHERITHVGGYESSQWKITLNDAIGKIERGEQAFSAQAHRKTVGVIVAVSPSGIKYLKAEVGSQTRFRPQIDASVSWIRRHVRCQFARVSRIRQGRAHERKLA